MDMGDVMVDAGTSAQERAERVAQSQAMLQLLPQIAVAFSQGSWEEQLQGLASISKMLSFVEVVRTPQQRFVLRDGVQAVFDQLTNLKVIPRVLQYLTLVDQPHHTVCCPYAFSPILLT